mmetsp:Transcript_129336/g.258233  ORF Transcript_129336/g.258233 Transcript_129336/m.258233 type:complete len:259 (+) Transcript_129336:79-855(+)
MGAAALPGVGCCYSQHEDFYMDTVTPQSLTQTMFPRLLQHQAAAEANPETEEEVEVPAKCTTVAKAERAARNQLLHAVRQDDAPRVLTFVADGTSFDVMGEALRLAAYRGSASVVRELVAVGLSVNVGDPHTGFAPLQLAAATGHLAVCELLLDALADAQRSVDGASAATLAKKMGHSDIEDVLDRHMATLLLEEQGEGTTNISLQHSHVLPRVSPVLSQAMLEAMPTSLPAVAHINEGQPPIEEIESDEDSTPPGIM